MASSPMLALPSGERDRPRNLTTIGVLVSGIGSLMGFAALLAAYINVSHFNKPWPPGGVRIQNYTGTMLSLTIPPAVGTSARLEITHVEYREVYNGPANLEKEIHWWIKNTGTVDASYAIHMATIRD